MDTVIYFSLSVTYTVLFVVGSIFAIRDRWSIWSISLLLVIAALFYDNSILALGRYIGEGRLLELLNAQRYWLHALITPLLIPFVWESLRSAGIDWVKTPLVLIAVVILTASTIITEVIPLIDLTLKAVWQQDILSYRRVSDSGWPFMIMTVTSSILIASLLLWRKQGWKWLFVGLILMGVVGILSIPFESKAFGNISELVLILSLFGTQLFQNGRIL